MDLSILSNALHALSQGCMYPVIAALLLAVAYALFAVGSALVEYFVEHRYFKVVLPELQHAIDKADENTMSAAVKESGLLLTQKKALLTLFNNRDLAEEARWALAKKLLEGEAKANQSKVLRDETMAKVAPMLGLMGTLIPLGPGVVAMGQGVTETLASSLLVAFDTTVAGLIVGAICLIVARVRRTWYTDYAQSLEAATTTMLEKIDEMEKAHGGRLVVASRDMDNLDEDAAAKHVAAKDAQAGGDDGADASIDTVVESATASVESATASASGCAL